MNQQPILLRVGEAAKLLSVSRSRAYELIHQGKIPSLDLGGTIRVPYDALQAIVRDSLQPKEGKYAVR